MFTILLDCRTATKQFRADHFTPPRGVAVAEAMATRRAPRPWRRSPPTTVSKPGHGRTFDFGSPKEQSNQPTADAIAPESAVGWPVPGRYRNILEAGGLVNILRQDTRNDRPGRHAVSNPAPAQSDARSTSVEMPEKSNPLEGRAEITDSTRMQTDRGGRTQTARIASNLSRKDENMRFTRVLVSWLLPAIVASRRRVPPPSIARAAEVQPEAIQVLRGATDYLAGLKQFRAEMDMSIEFIVEGQKLQYGHRTSVAVQRPNKIRAERVGDLGNQVCTTTANRWPSTCPIRSTTPRSPPHPRSRRRSTSPSRNST